MKKNANGSHLCHPEVNRLHGGSFVLMFSGIANDLVGDNVSLTSRFTFEYLQVLSTSFPDVAVRSPVCSVLI